MYLMDEITGFAAALRQRPDPVVSGYIDLADRLVGAPRFLLDAKATRTAVELNLGRPKVMVEAMAHLHIPYSKLWVEWDDGDRQALREKFDEQQDYAELRPMPRRVGFLLEAEAGGRRGTATWAWLPPASEGYGVPNVGAVQPYFDLDRRFEVPDKRIGEGLLKGNLARLWLDSPVQLNALFDIWRTCEHLPSIWGGRHYWPALGNDPLMIDLCYSDVVGEYIMIWAVMLMLTASRPLLAMTPVDQGKINKHRVRRGEEPLLDHTRVSLRLSPKEQRPVIRSELGYARKSPRVHLVSRYLARRGDKHWVVEPYWRGSGQTISRHVHVQG